MTKITRPLLRKAAWAVLEHKLGYGIELDDRAQGVTPGARLRATKDTATVRVAVRTAVSRRIRAVRRDDGGWRTIPDADLVVVAVPARNRSDAIEILGFDPRTVVEYFNAALKDLPSNTPTDAPVIVALDEKVRGRSRSVPSGLKPRSLWQYVLAIDDPLLKEVARAQSQEGFVERVKREFAELNGVDVDKVVVEFKIIS